MNASIRILPDEKIGVISPLLHGHFAEHLGRCCYDGLWDRNGAPRPQVVAALRRIGVPILRWPGGCFADLYHWRDGIGPAEQRPLRYAESCGERVVDNNRVGTHEFIALCQAIGAEPYLAGNMGSGAVQELADWVDYCNGSFDTTLTRERAANGHPAPMNVKYWGIGNESWGCGGNFDPVHYAHEYRRYATMVKRVDPTTELVAVGHDRNRRDWNLRVIETLRDHLDLVQHLSLHRYWGAGEALDPSEEAYYRLQHGSQLVDGDIREARSILDYYTSSSRRPGQRVGIAFDEWGVWHAEARLDAQFEAPSTWRDALAAAAALDVFHSHCDIVTMANLAQIANVLQPLLYTHGDDVQVTPTGEVFALYAAHRGAAALRIAVEECPERELPAWRAEPSFAATQPPARLPYLSATASQRDGRITLTLTNRHRTEPLAVRVHGLNRARKHLLSAASTEATQTSLSLSEQEGETVVIPAASVASLTFGA